jgi:hypothetical protein
MIKVDISDGFYQVWLRLEDIAQLSVAFPSLKGEEPLIALPLALLMGWKNAPPIFTTVTETVANIANQRILKWRNLPPHRLDTIADTKPAEPIQSLQTISSITTAVPQPTIIDPSLQHPPRRPRSFCG